MQWVKDDVFAPITARMTGDGLPAAADHHLIDIATDPGVLMAIGNRDGIVVGSVAHQRLGGDPAAGLVAGLEGRGRQRSHRRQIALQPFADRLALTA